MTRVTKVEAGENQLEWAIRLLVDHSAYIPAITLAGAAEEVFGALLGEDAILKVIARDVGDPPTGMPKVFHVMNETRNWMKHNSPEAAAAKDFDLVEQTALIINRALMNLKSLGRPPLASFPRMERWMRENYPESFTPAPSP